MKKNQTIIDDFSDEDKVEQNLNIWNYEEQPEIVGVVQRRELGVYGDQIIIQDSSNEEVVLPTLTALNTKLLKANVGDKIKVVFKGEIKSQKTGRMYKDFDVFIKEQKE